MRYFKAKYKSVCKVCTAEIKPGDSITKWGSRYAHEGCAEADHNKILVDGGLTYRSQRKSAYRRKIHRD